MHCQLGSMKWKGYSPQLLPVMIKVLPRRLASGKAGIVRIWLAIRRVTKTIMSTSIEERLKFLTICPRER